MTGSSPARRPSAAKILVTVIVAVCLAILTLEVGARLVFYVKEGFNPFYVTFGFRPDPDWNSRDADGYSKFQPHSIFRHKISATEILYMRINADGFRGLKDFTRPKPPGVFRIVVLGESSTFGYGVKDEETYPYQLEQQMNARSAGRRVEVLNLGLPLARMNNILAVARHEVPSLEPDLILLYAGYNNAMFARDDARAEGVVRLKNWLYHHSVAWRSVHAALTDLYYRVTKRLNRDVVGLPHMSVPIDLRRDRIEAARASAVAEYANDVRALAAFAAQRRIPLVLITQTMTLYHLAPEFHDRWRTYREEMARVQRTYAETGRLPTTSVALLIHGDLMAELQRVACEYHLTLVDGLTRLEQDRARMLGSYVHLTRLGNQTLAALIADSILK
jgi:lysophospholipase L1-like esterase